MCTVSFVPIKDGYIFTSNRDESPQRAAAKLVVERINNKNILFPKDPESSGSWIAVSDTGQLLCILNGAFKSHRRRPPYKLSRGVMALQFFEYQDTFDFVTRFDFNGIEPFTCLIVEQDRVHEIRWDKDQIHHNIYPYSEPKIWSSCTLYDMHWQQKRQEWFDDWRIKVKSSNQEQILQFHRTSGVGDSENDLVMNRMNIVQTTSITSVKSSRNSIQMKFESLTDGNIQVQELILAV